jgi:hypothetical protein
MEVVTNMGPTATKNNLTAVVESWGYFIGYTFTERKYRNLAPLIADEQVRRLERQRRDDTTPKRYNLTLDVWEGWIPWGMNHDLIDVGEPAVTGINDLVSNYTVNGIFNGYTSSVTTISGLRTSILSNNGNNQATQVNTLFTSYGW